MIETYIYLDQQDKAKLIKTATAKQLSLSSYINIIVKHYIMCETNKESYIHKGQFKIHIKLRAKEYNADSLTITNCVYRFLHNNEFYTEINYKKLNSMIQSECDTTIDPNYLKNMIIRNTYHKEHKK